MNYSLSKIDQKRFGIVTAKATLNENDDIQGLIEKSIHDQVKFLIIRTPTTALNIVQKLEQEGAFLADTLIYYIKRKLEITECILPTGYTMRLANSEDADRLEQLALETFKDYSGHYHSDPNLNNQDCNLVYSSWAASSCIDKNTADSVILIEKNKEITAFATIKINNPDEIDGILFGVSPEHRNKHLHMSLMKLSQNWGVNNGYQRMITSTQITNTVVQKNWCRSGFEPYQSYYTLHKWFS
jgi:hypothetical protein